MVTDEAALAAMIGSRICHDLISPIGAIGNGVELLTMTGQADAPEVALISDSVANANARIRFFRIAYGLAPVDSAVGRDEIARIIDDTYRGSRFSAVWTPDGPQPRAAVKVAFLCLQCLERAMPRGGEAVVRRDAGTWRVEGHAETLCVEDRLWQPLRDPAAPLDVTSAEVEFAILHRHARARAPTLTVEIGDDRIAMHFRSGHGVASPAANRAAFP